MDATCGGPSITPWSELEGRQIAEDIKKAEKSEDADTAENLKQIDRRARFFSGDKPPEYDK